MENEMENFSAGTETCMTCAQTDQFDYKYFVEHLADCSGVMQGSLDDYDPALTWRSIEKLVKFCPSLDNPDRSGCKLPVAARKLAAVLYGQLSEFRLLGDDYIESMI